MFGRIIWKGSLMKKKIKINDWDPDVEVDAVDGPVDSR